MLKLLRDFDSAKEITNTLDSLDAEERKEIFFHYNSRLWERDSLDQIFKFHEELINAIILKRNNERSKISSVAEINEKQENEYIAAETAGIDSIYVFIGDLHFDKTSLNSILKNTSFFSNERIRLVFLGDYIDRGSLFMDTVENMVLLNLLFKERIVMLRGNHDNHTVMNGRYFSEVAGEDDEIFTKWLRGNHVDEKYICSYAMFFSKLPIVFMLKTDEINIIGVHGGIPRPDLGKKNYYSFENVQDYLMDNDSVGYPNYKTMLWADPFNAENGIISSELRYKFYKIHFDHFMSRIGADLLIRGHEPRINGYGILYCNKLISIFSSGGKDDFGNRNDNSYYSDITPDIAVVDMMKKQIIIAGINFSGNKLNDEKIIEFVDVKKRELDLKEYVPIDQDADRTGSSDGRIKYISFKDIKNTDGREKTIITSAISNKILNAEDLSCFYGINKNVKLKIENGIIYNLSDCKLMINGEVSNCAQLKNHDIISIDGHSRIMVSIKYEPSKGENLINIILKELNIFGYETDNNSEGIIFIIEKLKEMDIIINMLKTIVAKRPNAYEKISVLGIACNSARDEGILVMINKTQLKIPLDKTLRELENEKISREKNGLNWTQNAQAIFKELKENKALYESEKSIIVLMNENSELSEMITEIFKDSLMTFQRKETCIKKPQE